MLSYDASLKFNRQKHAPRVIFDQFLGIQSVSGAISNTVGLKKCCQSTKGLDFKWCEKLFYVVLVHDQVMETLLEDHTYRQKQSVLSHDAWFKFNRQKHMPQVIYNEFCRTEKVVQKRICTPRSPKSVLSE